MKLKQLQWRSDNLRVQQSRLDAGFSSWGVSNDKRFDDIGVFREKSEDTWRVTIYESTYWGDYYLPLCMTLDSRYTLDEVKQFVQDGWEHCVMKDFFEETENGL